MKLPRLIELRQSHNLTQTDVANILGTTQRSYFHYETGSRAIPLELLIALCDYYGVTLDYLVGRSE